MGAFRKAFLTYLTSIVFFASLSAQDTHTGDTVMLQRIQNILLPALDSFYNGSPETYGGLFTEHGVMWDLGRILADREIIMEELSEYPIPPVTFTTSLFLLQSSEDHHILSYVLEEEEGFKFRITEVWVASSHSDLELIYAHWSDFGAEPGMGLPKFVISSAGLGLFLFALLLVLNNARKARRQDKVS